MTEGGGAVVSEETAGIGIDEGVGGWDGLFDSKPPGGGTEYLRKEEESSWDPNRRKRCFFGGATDAMEKQRNECLLLE